ncbi:hypothetical protein ICE98_02177 [Lactococcus lactis]|nr:hypothetical protein [Lactococcus lactis]
MSKNELIRWIENERCLIARLEKIFSDLETKKAGIAHGKKLIGIEPLERFSSKKRNPK